MQYTTWITKILVILTILNFINNKFVFGEVFNKNKKPKIKIIVTKYKTWRKAKPYYDIKTVVMNKLEDIGFEVMPEDSDRYDFILRIEFLEKKGNLCYYRGDVVGYGTDISLKFWLYRKDGSLIVKDKIYSKAPDFVKYEDAYTASIRAFKTSKFMNLPIIILSNINYKEAIELVIRDLINNLKSQDKDIRIAAAEALGIIRDERAVEPLINALQDSDVSVKKKAMESLRKIGTPRAIGAIKTLRGSFIFIECIGSSFLYFDHPSLYNELDRRGISYKKIEEAIEGSFEWGGVKYGKNSKTRHSLILFTSYWRGNNKDETYPICESSLTGFGYHYRRYFLSKRILNPFIGIGTILGGRWLKLEGKNYHTTHLSMSLNGGIEWEIQPKKTYVRLELQYMYSLLKLGFTELIRSGWLSSQWGEKLENVKDDINGFSFKLSIGRMIFPTTRFYWDIFPNKIKEG
jgi:hypothetical protein